VGFHPVRYALTIWRVSGEFIVAISPYCELASEPLAFWRSAEAWGSAPIGREQNEHPAGGWPEIQYFH